MAASEHRNHAKRFLAKAEEYVASAEDNLDLGRLTVAAGDAVHAGISAKDAIVTTLTGSTSKGKDHTAASRELAEALGKRPSAAPAERALRDLLGAKGAVEYGTTLIARSGATALVRRARTLVDLALEIVRAGG